MLVLNETTVSIGSLDLQCGERLENVEQRVTTYGDPRNPAVLVAHALTGNSRVTDWWSDLTGPGKPIDP